MARYIDAEKLRCRLYEADFHTPDERWRPESEFAELIDTTPTADVVEVVRCKDCKHQDDCARQMVHTTRDSVLEQNKSTYNKVDFCSYGKRKDDT
jgi:hypothetical protein